MLIIILTRFSDCFCHYSRWRFSRHFSFFQEAFSIRRYFAWSSPLKIAANTEKDDVHCCLTDLPAKGLPAIKIEHETSRFLFHFQGPQNACSSTQRNATTYLLLMATIFREISPTFDFTLRQISSRFKKALPISALQSSYTIISFLFSIGFHIWFSRAPSNALAIYYIYFHLNIW